MNDLTVEERKILALRASGGGQLVSTSAIDKKLIELGYIEQKLGGLKITQNGLKRLMSN